MQEFVEDLTPDATHWPPMKQEFAVSAWVHLPALHTSAVQVLPSLAQVVPSARADQAVADLAGSHPAQESVGDLSPLARHLPPMKHAPVAGAWVHLPALHTSAVQERPSLAQAAPSVSGDQAVVEAAGTQPIHELEGDLSPLA